jgi:hypothetical protein
VTGTTLNANSGITVGGLGGVGGAGVRPQPV